MLYTGNYGILSMHSILSFCCGPLNPWTRDQLPALQTGHLDHSYKQTHGPVLFKKKDGRAMYSSFGGGRVREFSFVDFSLCFTVFLYTGK